MIYQWLNGGSTKASAPKRSISVALLSAPPSLMACVYVVCDLDGYCVSLGNQPRLVELVVSGIAGLQYFSLIGQVSTIQTRSCVLMRKYSISSCLSIRGMSAHGNHHT